MNYAAYRAAYFADPPPVPRFDITGPFGLTLFYADYEAAVDFYTQVLGPPAYVEGASTRGWPLGAGWLTLLRGQSGAPQNVEVTVQMGSPEEAERLQRAFIAAGGVGAEPSDQLMYVPVRACAVRDPFGVEWLIVRVLA
jgi:catechol 2,3-dioxygenase-like lactoylglutathione lyase family enzyme